MDRQSDRQTDRQNELELTVRLGGQTDAMCSDCETMLLWVGDDERMFSSLLALILEQFNSAAGCSHARQPSANHWPATDHTVTTDRRRADSSVAMTDAPRLADDASYCSLYKWLVRVRGVFRDVAVKQSSISTAWQQPVTEHVSQRRLNTYRFGQLWTPPGAVVAFLGDSGARYKCHDLTYLLTYLLTNCLNVCFVVQTSELLTV